MPEDGQKRRRLIFTLPDGADGQPLPGERMGSIGVVAVFKVAPVSMQPLVPQTGKVQGACGCRRKIEKGYRVLQVGFIDHRQIVLGRQEGQEEIVINHVQRDLSAANGALDKGLDKKVNVVQHKPISGIGRNGAER